MGGVFFTGDWQRLMGNLDRVSNRLKSDTGKAIGRSLAKIERTVLDHVDAQDLAWEPLTDAYAARKAAAGLDPDTLRATNQMYENITTDQPNDFSGAVGVTRGVLTKDGEDVTEIALIHEQPDDDGKVMPARKLWKPSFEEVKDDVAAQLAGVTIRAFKK